MDRWDNTLNKSIKPHSGIQKKKRGRMLYDDVAKEWKPRYGFNKAGGDKEQNWVVEVGNHRVSETVD